MLQLEGVRSCYGRVEVLHGITLEVDTREVVALIGANGAGKTTLMRVVSGVQPIAAGTIHFCGTRIDNLAGYRRVAMGVTQVPEGRQVFTSLSVEDNLRLGAWLRQDRTITSGLDRAYAMFPALADMRARPAGALSGGQQQMLAIGRALMADPRLLLLDEPSLGLAPKLVDDVFRVISELKQGGLTILLVEQNAQAALAVADRAYVLETGHVTLHGTAVEVHNNPRVREAYLGI